MKRELLALWVLALGCGSPPPPAYVTESNQAEAARRRGDHASAAQHYQRAAELALKPRDADEARYRAAEAYAQGGDLSRARALYGDLVKGGGERAERADFELAELLERAGRDAEADAWRARALHRHPSSGLAPGALRRHLDYLRDDGGAEAVLGYLEGDAQALLSTELGEAILYRRARELDDAGRASEARDAYLACAAAFPYPAGAYWDDSLYRAAEQELKLGAPALALAHLTRLLDEREAAHITGSYQRGRYAEAQLKIAEIYRDSLHDDARARRELRKVWQEHPTSRLGDEALFEEALLARRGGDLAGTCEPLRLLVTEAKSSRYAPCAALLCPSLKPDEAAPRDCHDYIKRAAGLP
jgi:tetratricopeptide (TPR) repeat protein